MRLISTIVLVMMLVAGSAMATTVIFTGSGTGSYSGSSFPIAASAKFESSGSNLVVTLTNTSISDVGIPAEILTTLFFTLAGDPTLTPVSAVLAPGSQVYFDPDLPNPFNGIVGGEWVYVNHLSGAPRGANEGIASAGLGFFGSDGFFPGPNLDDPDAVNGQNYGITSAGDNMSTGNPAVTGKDPFIKNSVIFTLSGLPDDYDLTNSISNLSFQYGTDLAEPNLPPDTPDTPSGPPTPEPSTLILIGTGLVGIVSYGRIKFNKKK